MNQGSDLNSVKIGVSRWRFGLLLFACLGFVVGAVCLLMFDPDGAFLGGSTILFFGGGAGITFWQLVDDRPRLVIDDAGILDRTIGVGLIAWSDIEGAYVKSIQGNDFICLELRDPDSYRVSQKGIRRAMASANRSLGFTDFNVNLMGLPIEVEEVYELIIKKLEAARSTAKV